MGSEAGEHRSMSIASRIFRRWLSRRSKLEIGEPGDLFFTRYDVLKTRWGAVYLHEFFRSDNDLCLHDR